MKRKKEKYSIKSGEKFGRLTVISYTDRKDKKGEYKCKCKCGNITYARTWSLKTGRHKSCGCLMKEKAAKRFTLPNNQGLVNELYKNYKNSAKRRNYDFYLTKEQFKNIITGNCYFCGSEPLKTITPSRKRKFNNNDFKYNGVDRLNNNLGYFIENVVTCCYICNNAKNILTMEEFISWVNKIYSFQKLQKRSTTIPKGSTSKQMETGNVLFKVKDKDIV